VQQQQVAATTMRAATACLVAVLSLLQVREASELLWVGHHLDATSCMPRVYGLRGLSSVQTCSYGLSRYCEHACMALQAGDV
jgi:hypothetical protein